MKEYFGEFDGLDNVVEQFCVSKEQLEGIEIIYACYCTGDYQGEAHVIFRKEGKGLFFCILSRIIARE